MSKEENKLEKTIGVLNKTFGKGAVVKLTGHTVLNREVLHTGSLGLDQALGGGILKGRLGELFGPESSGKTTLALHMIAEAQKTGHVLFADVEHALDPNYAVNLGVDLDKLLVTQPDCSEDVFEIMEAIAATGEVSLIVLDSVAGLSPRAEIEGDSGDANMGLLARQLGQNLRKIKNIIYKTGTVVLYLNQIRMKIGVVFGNPETTPGGNGLKFFSSFRMDIRRIKTNKKEGIPESITSRVRIVKNKMAPPLKEAIFDIDFGTGINTNKEIIIIGKEKGIIETSGTWYSYGTEQLGQGADNAAKLLGGTPKLREEIIKKILA